MERAGYFSVPARHGILKRLGNYCHTIVQSLEFITNYRSFVLKSPEPPSLIGDATRLLLQTQLVPEAWFAGQVDLLAGGGEAGAG
jgi:hypothetical protein